MVNIVRIKENLGNWIRFDVKKIVITSNNIVQVKHERNDTTEVLSVDISNMIDDIEYRMQDYQNVIHSIKKSTEITSASPVISLDLALNIYDDRLRNYYSYEFGEFPRYIYTASDETKTPETATKTIIFPPRETPLEWLERIHARIFHVTQRIQVLRHEEPHQNALSEKICREVPEDHDEVLRYDISCNLIKRPIGWLALQMENYESKYSRHLAAVEVAKKANRTIPTFNDQNDRNTIETMLEKIEESLTEECLRDHFDLHRTADWNPIQNTQRKITLCNDDANRTPGEVLVDVNAFFTDGRGRIAQEHAKKTYHDISTKYWVKAKRTSHRKLVTERIVNLD